ncbi:C40 family peptidase [Mycolicibacterium goodii]|uniref:C40 family peptidase n=1 Tax=Mycolicibacterium goodii TaxID=134601 RepID=UPI0009F819F0|nr:NlpC/P60 family protein [Mycolicibacterium goodii]MBU8817569.1 C40 family peptidase [Mycolicibacterium goodii]
MTRGFGGGLPMGGGIPMNRGGGGSLGGGGLPGLPSLGSGGSPRLNVPDMSGAAPALARNGDLRHAIVNAAAEKLGTIYKWGGKGGPADGGRVDCSGLTSYAYRKFGIDIGPDTFTQITKGVQISPRDIQPGDLIFSNFGSQGGNPGPGHVVMATGYGPNSRIIEASSAGQPVAFGNMPTGRIVVKRIIP